MAPPSTRPSNPPEWATNAGTRDPVPLPAGLQATGWVDGTVLPAKVGNSLWGSLTDWAVYLSASSPTAGMWDVSEIRVFDGSDKILTIDRTTVGLDDYADLTTAVVDGLRLKADGIDPITLTMFGTSATLVVREGDSGQVILEGDATGVEAPSWSTNAAGGKYEYASTHPRTIIVYADPASGGWTWGTVPTDAYWLLGAADNWRPYNLTGSVVTLYSRHPLDVRQACRLTRLWATMTCLNVAQPVWVHVMRGDRSSPGTATSILAVSLGTVGTSEVDAIPGGGFVALDPTLYYYYFEIESIDVPSSGGEGSGATFVRVTLDVFDVETM